MKRVRIITVSYDSTGFLKDCLNSILNNDSAFEAEVIVIDNDSPSREVEKFPQLYPDVKFIFSGQNKGFGAGCNRGSLDSNEQYLLFLNPDTILPKNALTEMMTFMDEHPEAFSCAPVYMDFEGRPAYTFNRFPNIRWEFCECLGIGHEKEIDRYLKDIDYYNHDKEFVKVDWLTGACLMVRNSLFKEVKFDEDYFLYYEDTDLQKRFHKKGLSNFCLKNLEIKHFVNSTISDKDYSDVYHFHIHRSKMLYYYKNEGFFIRNLVRFLMLAGTLLRMVSLFIRRKFRQNRMSKLQQYVRMLNIYTSSFEKLRKYGQPD